MASYFIKAYITQEGDRERANKTGIRVILSHLPVLLDRRKLPRQPTLHGTELHKDRNTRIWGSLGPVIEWAFHVALMSPDDVCLSVWPHLWEYLHKQEDNQQTY